MTTTDLDSAADEPTNERAETTVSEAGSDRDDRYGPSERDSLTERIDRLEAENERLRREYARLRGTRNRARATGLVAVGLVAIGGGFVLHDVRNVLFALGATGLFGAVLIYFLSPGTVVTAGVGERIYAALATNQRAIAGALGLEDDVRYVPIPASERTLATCRLFVPRYREYDLPDADDGPIVTDENARGLALEPTGMRLFHEFERTLTSDLASDPSLFAVQLVDALVEVLELASSAEVDVVGNRATFAVSDSAFGDVDRFDHPIPSFFAVGLAMATAQPVAVEVTDGDDRADWLVTCRWEERRQRETAGDEQ
ncbi:hypothetical protein [Natrarchaeobius oligotrophus]|uniref:DUF7982 domain-containing protein n=1 Tax=Natrarchaeobius chitinivorans TaxID=1679083 RepID=A0A3N6MBM1_NATCH|nr:hypothetical protein [Natrarchaeobius chitinivorans]RQH01234.1 hypothetical protein EA472_07205 [Natrarchaeobius chitinivorans]